VRIDNTYNMIKNGVKLITLLSLFFLAELQLTAQNSTIVLTEIVIGELPVNTGIQDDIDSVSYLINFTVNDLSGADILNIYLGSEHDSSDVLMAQANFYHLSGVIQLECEGQLSDCHNNQGLVHVRLSIDQIVRWRCITLLIEDQTGLSSNKLYYSL